MGVFVSPGLAAMLSLHSLGPHQGPERCIFNFAHAVARSSCSKPTEPPFPRIFSLSGSRFIRMTLEVPVQGCRWTTVLGMGPTLPDAVAGDSGAAEVQATLWLVLWLLQAPEHRPRPLVVFTDNLLV
eukprot:1635088-Pyramimonas_sp.AAC.1